MPSRWEVVDFHVQLNVLAQLVHPDAGSLQVFRERAKLGGEEIGVGLAL